MGLAHDDSAVRPGVADVVTVAPCESTRGTNGRAGTPRPNKSHREDVWLVTISGVCAFAIGCTAPSSLKTAATLAVIPFAIACLVRPSMPFLVGIGLLPFSTFDVIGREYSNFNAGPSDVMFVLAGLCSLAPIVLRSELRSRLQALRGPWLVTLPFFTWVALSTAAHPGQHTLLNALQIVELVAFPAALAVVWFDKTRAQQALIGFTSSALVLAVVAAATQGHAIQTHKNPIGQYLVDALFIVLALVQDNRVRWPLLTVLTVGIFFSSSRGALLGASVGALVLLSIRGLGSWRRTLGVVLPLAVIVIIGYNVVPASVQERLRVVSGGNTNDYSDAADFGARYNIRLRAQFRRDGIALANAHPLLGVGPGNYLAGDPRAATETNDPHNVLIRTAAEFGYPGVILFVGMYAGTGLLLLRRLNRNPYAALALAVQAAIFAHSLTDVYWVRGTPVIGWTLVAMAMSPRLDHATGDQE